MNVFEAIYSASGWGRGSGPGSDPGGLGPYYRFLEKLLQERRPKRVVDLGCGSFEPYAGIDWQDSSYVGIDVVELCIKRNARYSSPTRVFKVGDWLDMADLPEADLVICKDVLQHWCHADVCKGLAKLSKYPCCLITNSVVLGQSEVNSEIRTGNVRPLNLLIHPYFIRASACETYDVVTNRERDRKQILVWEPNLHPLEPLEAPNLLTRQPPEAHVKIGYEAADCPEHERAYYGGLVARLKDEFGDDFEPFQCADFNDLVRLDGKYDLIICKTRMPAQIIADHCRKTKSFVIDHGPIASNRIYIDWHRAHFEVFSSPTLQRAYESTGFKPMIKGYSGGYFLTKSLDTTHPEPNSCLVYLTPWEGARANSLTPIPFSEGDTVALLQRLSALFERVYVVSHLGDARGNFATRHRGHLPQLVLPLAHGPEFQSLVCNVGAIVFEYSSVFATALWNPEVRLFYRRPPRPYGPTAPHNQIFHYIMDEVSYPIVGDDVRAVKDVLLADPKKNRRAQAKRLVYDESVKDPYDAVVSSICDAWGLVFR